MAASEVAALERRLQTHHRELQQALSESQQPLMLRALESMCARQAAASGVGYAVLEGTLHRKPLTRRGFEGGGGDGRGSIQVRLSAGGVMAEVYTHNAEQRERVMRLGIGQKLRVRLRNVDGRGGRVQVELME
jgi:hypothetical protein